MTAWSWEPTGNPPERIQSSGLSVLRHSSLNSDKGRKKDVREIKDIRDIRFGYVAREAGSVTGRYPCLRSSPKSVRGFQGVGPVQSSRCDRGRSAFSLHTEVSHAHLPRLACDPGCCSLGSCGAAGVLSSAGRAWQYRCLRRGG